MAPPWKTAPGRCTYVNVSLSRKARQRAISHGTRKGQTATSQVSQCPRLTVQEADEESNTRLCPRGGFLYWARRPPSAQRPGMAVFPRARS